jgi:hypothetical protein
VEDWTENIDRGGPRSGYLVGSRRNG